MSRVLPYVQVNLKRKHWDQNASQGRSSKRCTHIFEQQLANARQQSSAGLPRGVQQGGKAQGKKELKPWQLKKEKASQQAAQVHLRAVLLYLAAININRSCPAQWYCCCDGHTVQSASSGQRICMDGCCQDVSCC